MRIISFSQRWSKLLNQEFTTFRYPRVDRDWHLGEEVQVYFKNRSPKRERLGIARIIKKELRDLDMFYVQEYIIVTDEEAVEDGFKSLQDMVDYMEGQYKLDYISLFNKLTLEWISRELPSSSKNI